MTKAKTRTAAQRPPADNTARKQLEPFCYKPGQSGNPRGRPKGSRNALGEDFLRALQQDFALHGASTIEKVREERPHEYLKLVAGILPKELNVNKNPVEDLTDEDLQALIEMLHRQVQADDEDQPPRSH